MAHASGAQLRRWVKCAAVLLDAGAAALNQNNEHDDKENTGSDTNQDCAIHFENPFRG
jgi:hypothetical protein